MIQGSRFGVKGSICRAGAAGAVVVVLRRRCFFSELRVITLKREKYSILKTTTTTDYLHQSLKPQQAEAAVALEEAAINFFLRHTFIYCTHMRKNRTPPVACWENSNLLKSRSCRMPREAKTRLIGRGGEGSVHADCSHPPIPEKR